MPSDSSNSLDHQRPSEEVHSEEDTELIKLLETVETAAWSDFYRSAPQPLAEQLGIRLIETTEATSIIATKIDVLAANRVLNLGINDVVAESRLDEIILDYKQSRVSRFFISLSPAAQPLTLHALLENRGLTYYNNWVKLHRGVEPPPKVQSEVIVKRIDTTQAHNFGEICGSCFGWPEESYLWIAATVGRPNWHHYMAFDGSVPVATGAFFVSNDCAWIGFAATLPEARGRGAQGALVSQRLVDIAHLGCKNIVVETAEQTPERNAPSYRNMIRFGFEEAYKRPNFLKAL